MKAAFLDPERHKTTEVNVETDEEFFHTQLTALIRCDFLTCSRAATDQISYVIFSDDLALRRPTPRPYSVTGLGAMIPGPCVIFGDDGVDDIRGLSSTELKRFGCGSGDGTASMYHRNWYTDKGYKTATEAEQWLKKFLRDH